MQNFFIVTKVLLESIVILIQQTTMETLLYKNMVHITLTCTISI